MKIAILNESFLKDSHIARLKALGEVVVYSDTNNEADAIKRLEGVEVAVADCWLTPLNEEVFSHSPSLRYVSLNSTGYDQVDLDAANRHAVSIANVPGFSTDSVAEHVIGLTFASVRHIPQADVAMRKKPFQVEPADEQSISAYLGFNLRGKTMGVVGLGRIGTRVAELAYGLGMKVIAYNRTPRDIPGVTLVDKETLLRESDVVSLNMVLSDDTVGYIGVNELKLMKPTAYLINTARGGLVDEAALFEALEKKTIAGAGLDVISDWSEDNPLLKLDNVVLTPHLAYLTEESLENMADIIVTNIEQYTKHEFVNIVNT